jgi:MFS family permease
MDSTPTPPDPPSSSRSSVLSDFAAARAAAEGTDASPNLGGPALEQPSEVGPRFSLDIAAGVIVFTVGAFVAIGIALGAVIAVLGLALAIACTWATFRRRRLGAMGGLGLAGSLGWVLLLGGFVLGSRSYDERFIYDNQTAFWDAVSLFGALMSVIGVLLIVISILGIVLVAVVRLGRRAASSA